MRDCEQIDGAVVEQLSGAEYVRAADTYALEEQRLAHVAETRRQRELHHHWHMSLYGFGKAINENVFHLLILGLAAYLAVQEQITCGDILVFSVLYMNVMAPLNEVHRLLDEGHEVSLRVGDLIEILDEPQDHSFAATARAVVRCETGRPAIRIEDLVVDYVTSEGVAHRGLHGVSLQIMHGESIGFVGPSGSGKSTCIKTILRLLHPTAGRIWLGDSPLEQVSRTEIAKQIGYVGQNPFLFSGTIAENIAYGNGVAPEAEIHQAAAYAHLHQEILRMPGGYQAVVSERGHNLSGGQRQRLSIARILLQPRPILILDEATSALDNISERRVQEALGITTSDKTTLIIAHRLSALRDCNRILVFDHGKIVEVGSYNELLQQGGLFTRLVRSAENGVLTDRVAEAAKPVQILDFSGGPELDPLAL